MLQPAFGDCVLGPTARLCARVLFVTPPPTPAAQAALQSEIYSNLISRYGAGNKRENALLIARNDRDDELLGACGVNVERQPLLAAESDEYVPVLANLVVEPEARRRGIARRLVRECEDIARGWGYRKLFLKVEQENAAARGMYQKLGYRATLLDENAEIPRASSNMFGASVSWVPSTLVVMEKDLSAFRMPSFLQGFLK